MKQFAQVGKKTILILAIFSFVIFYLFTKRTYLFDRQKSDISAGKTFFVEHCQLSQKSPYIDPDNLFEFDITQEETVCVFNRSLNTGSFRTVFVLSAEEMQALAIPPTSSFIRSKITVDVPESDIKDTVISGEEMIIDGVVRKIDIVKLSGCESLECTKVKVASFSSGGHRYRLEQYSPDATLLKSFNIRLKE